MALLQQLPDLGLSGFQVSHILCVEVAGLVDASADVVDIGGHSADGGSQLFLFGVVHLDDVTVNGHLAKIGSHVLSAQLRHFVFDEPVFIVTDAELDADWSSSICHSVSPYQRLR